jgi:hypothetical protein
LIESNKADTEVPNEVTMTNWLDRANAAYQERLAREAAEAKAKTQRLVDQVSKFLGEQVDPAGASIPGRVTVKAGDNSLNFAFADDDERVIAVIYECSFCGGEFPVKMDSMEDLGLYLHEEYPMHKAVCRNQKDD